MANIVKLGSLLLDGILMRPGSQYQPGQDIEFGNGDNISWIVVNGLLIADRPLLVNISWTDLEQQDLISGKAAIIGFRHLGCGLWQNDCVIGGQRQQCAV